MINKIHIKNFKSLRNIQVDCSNLNILSGLNGMGKSSLIQSLLLLRQSSDSFLKKEKKLNLQGEYTDIGTYKDAIFFLFESKENNISFTFIFDEQKLNITTVDYSESTKDDNQLAVKASTLKSSARQEAIFSTKKFQYLKAERVSDDGSYRTDSKKLENKDFGTTGQYAWQYFVKNRLQIINYDNIKHSKAVSSLIKDQINAWLGEISPNIMVNADYDENDTTKIIVDYQFRFVNESQIEDTTPRFKPKNIGFGISYVFSVVLALLTAEAGDLIIIENPEVHLHPKGQSKLAELMCLAAQAGVQIFCETHSDHIVNGTLVSVYEHSKNQTKGISHENVNILFFRKKESEAVSEVISAEISETGRFKQPKQKDFFDQIGIDVSRLSKR